MGVLLDENVPFGLVDALRDQRVDAQHVKEHANLCGQSDEPLLMLAAEMRRVIITRNVADFQLICKKWEREGRHHAGMIWVPATVLDVGELLRRTLVALAKHQGPWDDVGVFL